MSKARHLEIHADESQAPDGYPALTLALHYEKFVPDFSTELKEELPKGSRIWDGDGDGNWHVHPAERERLVEIAYRHFDEVYWVEDGRAVEVRSGAVQPTQESFF